MKLVTTAVGTATTLAALAPLLLMAPAGASTTSTGCTVTPLRPAASGTFTPSNVPKVDYKVRVTCNGGRTIQVQQFRMEHDQQPQDIDNIDDVTGTSLLNASFAGAAGSRTVGVRVPLVNTPGDGAAEEVFQKVRFRVTTPAGTSAWTAFEASAVRPILR